MKNDLHDDYDVLRPLADKGNVRAQYNLGVKYYHGRGVGQNYAEAAKWWRQAAEHGLVEAQYDLGLLCYHGQGVREDKVAAAKWWLLAADQGYVDAQFNIGGMYETGQGIAKDPVLAYFWLSLAARPEDKGAAETLNVLATKLQSEQLAEAKRLIAGWKPRQNTSE